METEMRKGVAASPEQKMAENFFCLARNAVMMSTAATIMAGIGFGLACATFADAPFTLLREGRNALVKAKRN